MWCIGIQKIQGQGITILGGMNIGDDFLLVFPYSLCMHIDWHCFHNWRPSNHILFAFTATFIAINRLLLEELKYCF